MPKPRYTIASVGFAGWIVLALMPLGCGGGLGHVTAKQDPSDTRPALPARTVERLQACVRDYGNQLGPGHYQFHPRARVDRERYDHGVSTEDMPESARDLSACTRVALRAMAIPQAVLQAAPPEDANETTNRSFVASPVVVVIVVVELTEVVFEAAAYSFLFAVSMEVVKVAEKDIADAARRRKPKNDECTDSYVECMGTPVSGEDGNTWKQTRCGNCRDRCRLDNAWPTEVGNGSCQYWQRNWRSWVN